MTKPGYKMTEIGEIPEEWEVYTFNTAFVSNNNKFLKIKTGQFKATGLFPIIDQGQNFISGYTDDEHALYDGDLPVIIFGDHTLSVKYIDFRFVVGADGTKILSPNIHMFVPKFLFFSIIGKNLKSEGYKRHFSKLRKESFLCPKIKEQQKIAEILTTADRMIDLIDTEIKAAERLKKGLMQTLLSKGIGHTKFKMTEIGEIPEEWMLEKIAKLGEIITGGTPSTLESSYWNGNIPWVASGDVHQKYIQTASKYITQEGLDNSNCKLLPIDTVLVALNGQGKTRGLSAILKIEATCNQSLAGVISKKDVLNPTFLLFQMLNRYTEIRNISGAGRNGLNLGHIKNFVIALSPLLEQQKIAELLTTVDRKIELLNKKKMEAERLKKGLMRALLTGQVRVKIDPSKGEN